MKPPVFNDFLLCFSNFNLYQKFVLSTSNYYQLKINNLDDFRFFIEPRIYYNLDSFGIYLTNRYRYHSTPYVPIKREDKEFLFGVEVYY